MTGRAARGWSIHTLVAGFTVGGILLCLTVSFLIAVAFPTPPAQTISLREAFAALAGSGDTPGWQSRIVETAPFSAAREGQALVIQAGLNGAEGGDIRARMLQPEGGASTAGRLDLKSDEAGESGSLQALLGGMASVQGARFAPFEMAVPREDGRWRVLTPATPVLTPQRLKMGLAFLLAAAVLMPPALWGAGRLTAPFRRLAETARGPSDRRAEAFVRGPREAVEAARAMDAMRDRLGQALRDRVAIMAAIAHDLRNPLTGLRLRIEGLAVESRVAAADDVARMERLIAQLLTYVRGEEAPWINEPLDLADLARDGVARQAALGREVRLQAEGEYLVRGDRDQLERALGNLIDNAVLYGDRALVTLASDGSRVRCTIDDAGPGLPPEQLEAVFSPFHRLETSRNRSTGGAGLGLAISRTIVERSGGSVRLVNRREGGLRAEIVLPGLDR